MKSYIDLLVVLMFIFNACTEKNGNVQIQNKSENKVKESKVNTILISKGPDVLFLTLNEKYFYVANVEDNFILVINT